VTCTGRAYQECAFRDLTTQDREFAWVLEELYNFLNLFFRLFQASHILERDLYFVFGIKQGSLRLADVKNLATCATRCYAAHQEPETKQQQDQEAPLEEEIGKACARLRIKRYPLLARYVFL